MRDIISQSKNPNRRIVRTEIVQSIYVDPRNPDDFEREMNTLWCKPSHDGDAENVKFPVYVILPVCERSL